MAGVVINLAAGESIAGLILRQKREIERLEQALIRLDTHLRLNVRRAAFSIEIGSRMNEDYRLTLAGEIAKAESMISDALGEVPDAG